MLEIIGMLYNLCSIRTENSHNFKKRVGTYSARVHNGNINGLLSTWKVLMEKKIYLLVGENFTAL